MKNLSLKIVLQLVVIITIALVLQTVLGVLLLADYTEKQTVASFKAKLESLAYHFRVADFKSGSMKTFENAPDTDEECIAIFIGNIRHDLSSKSCLLPDDDIVAMRDNVLSTGKFIVKPVGSVWVNFGYRKKSVLLGIPLKERHIKDGVIIGILDLKPVYHEVSRISSYLFAFIILNSIVMVVIGYFRLFKLVVKPLNTLINRAQNYKENGGLFIDHENSSVFRQLSSGLNSMVTKIEEDKRKLEHSVEKLEQVNKELEKNKNLLVRSETLASVGRFSAGMAHEIGNPLTIVQGYVDLLKQEDLSHDERLQFAKRANKEIERVTILLAKLLDFSQARTSESADSADIHLVINEVVSFLEIEKRFKEINVILVLDAVHFKADADADALKQVFINCLLNSADAFEDIDDARNHEIKIVTSNTQSSPDEESPVILITIADNGPGISPDILQTAFDPFVTTKDPGRGTGLGLYVCHNIVSGFGGTIESESSLSEGTRVCISMPVKRS